MSSKYQPQQFGWIGDLAKGANYLSSPDERLLYANENYCAFIRNTSFNQVFNLVIAIFTLIMGIFAMCWGVKLCFLIIKNQHNMAILFIIVLMIVAFLAVLYSFSLPEIYKNLSPGKGYPIIFNRNTQKVYINESYFFDFEFWRNPSLFLYLGKRRIKEYDWANLQGVVIHNYSRNALNTTMLMICMPGTDQTVGHIILDPARSGVGKTFVWGWINNFMVSYRLANINDGMYLSCQEAEFKKAHIEGQRWPEWMLDAFKASSLDELAQIKQKYGIKE